MELGPTGGEVCHYQLVDGLRHPITRTSLWRRAVAEFARRTGDAAASHVASIVQMMVPLGAERMGLLLDLFVGIDRRQIAQLALVFVFSFFLFWIDRPEEKAVLQLTSLGIYRAIIRSAVDCVAREAHFFVPCSSRYFIANSSMVCAIW